MAEAHYRVPPEESDDEVTNGKMGFWSTSTSSVHALFARVSRLWLGC